MKALYMILTLTAFCLSGTESLQAQERKTIRFHSSMLNSPEGYSDKTQIRYNDTLSYGTKHYLSLNPANFVKKIAGLRTGTAISLNISATIEFEGTVLPVLQTEKRLKRFRIQCVDGIADLLVSFFYNNQDEIEAFSAAVINKEALPYAWIIYPTAVDSSQCSWSVFALKNIIAE